MKKKKVWKWVGITVLVLVVVGIIAAVKVYSDLKSTVEAIYTPISEDEEERVSDKREEPVDVAVEKHPFSALILGIDERTNDVGRSDTMILLTVNPTLGTTKMLSIPRDTYTEIIGLNKQDKINHAYAFGGMEMSVETVEELFDIPIDYVAKVNMEGFKDIVDFVGGITVDNSFAFESGGESFKEGKISLNGDQALAYVRMRYDDPSGDFGRQNRQKQIVQEVLKKGVSFNTILNYQGALDILKNNVAMNLNFNEIQSIQKNYGSSLGKIEQLYMKNGHGTKIEGIYYYIPDETELAELQDTLKQHLEIK